MSLSQLSVDFTIQKYLYSMCEFCFCGFPFYIAQHSELSVHQLYRCVISMLYKWQRMHLHDKWQKMCFMVFFLFVYILSNITLYTWEVVHHCRKAVVWICEYIVVYLSWSSIVHCLCCTTSCLCYHWHLTLIWGSTCCTFCISNSNIRPLLLKNCFTLCA